MNDETPSKALAQELVDAALSVIEKHFSGDASEQTRIIIAQAYNIAANTLTARAYDLLDDLDPYDVSQLLSDD